MSNAVLSESRPKYIWWILGVTVLVVVAVTLVGILKSRKDSYGLLVQQGTAFTEALALACQNTVVAESYYDRLSADHYQDLADDLAGRDPRRLTADDLTGFVLTRDLFGAYVFDSTGQLLLSDIAQGPVIRPPDEVMAAVRRLVSDFATRSTVVFLEDTAAGVKIHYYIEVTNQLDRVIVIAADAGLYDEARSRTGIGILAQKMAAEPGIEYILYQSKEGIVVSSRPNGSFEAIESDPFLVSALDSDTIMARRARFLDNEILELVRPFATKKYPFGLLRVGVSLDRFVLVARRFDQIMVILAVALLGLIAVAVLYLSGRRERETLRRDITEIRSITDQIFAEISTGVMVVGPEGMVRLANRAVEKMFGVSLANRSVAALKSSFPPGLAELTGRDSDVEECELRIGTRGSERVLLVGRSTLMLSGEANKGVVLVVTDITQLKEYEATAARKERLSEMGHLAAAVAHEIRNPLNAISIAAQRLEAEMAPEDRKAEFVGFTSQIRNETKRLNEIITRFLSLSRTSEKQSVRTDVAACLSEFESLIGAEAERLGILLRVRSETGVYAAIEPARLKEVLLNLYNNAKEAIATTGAEHREVAIRAIRSVGRIRVTVSDSGPGIPKESRSRVFAPYFTTKEAGTGIGLAAVHQIVEGVGGKLAIEESELGGAAIIIELPESTS